MQIDVASHLTTCWHSALWHTQQQEDTNPLTRVEGDVVSNAFGDLELEYNVDIISDVIDKAL